ncbi:MAG: glycosyltransferase family 4 protein [Actinobacteria bacterium]|nr:glycosyltransferase family 4 protein [Actinomycetota bacterium]
MRILHVNKFLYRRGGAEGYMLDLSSLQSRAGHEVAHFAMRHPDNEPSRFEDRFPSRVDFDPPPPSLVGKFRGVGRLMYSTSARRGMEAVVDEFRPDLVHLHNIYHQLSPSILAPLRRRGIAAVMTLHDYKLACPTYRFLDHGRICEACMGRRFYQPILKRCNDGSIGASAVNAVEMTLHTFGRAYAPVHVFACPSRFIEGKMRQAGVFPERLRWIPNFVDPAGIEAKTKAGGGVVFAGRLSREKGVDVLVDAVARLDAELDVAGDGPERAALEERVRRLGVAGRVRFHGRLAPQPLQEVMRSSSVAVIPSRWYENQPITVLESFACGLPVVGTGLGGIPELVAPGVDGDLVPPNDAGALAESLGRLLGDAERAFDMGRAGREKVEREFSPPVHLTRLEAIYEEALARAGTRA